MWDTIWQLVVTVRHNPSFNSLIIGLFHLIVYLFSPSLSYLLSTEIMSHGFNCLLNHFVVFNVYITVKCFQYLFSPPLIELFEQCKDNIIKLSLLLRYISSKSPFLKTDWFADGMEYILMQPNSSPKYLVVITHLESTGDCTFDYTRSGPRLIYIQFNSRAKLDHEQDYHSFVGDIACGRWALSRLRKYLWETLFYWLCDCNTI